MSKNSGKNLEYWFGGREYPVESVGYDVDFNEIDASDSSTPSPATEVVLGRAKRTHTIDAFLFGDDGAEISSGTLTADVKYRVTAGTITEDANDYDVGKIFTSNGTGVASGTNRVVPLGARLNGKNMSATIGGVATPVTSLKFQDQYGEFDATDSGTSGDGTEIITGRTKRTTSVEVIQKTEDADKLIANPASVAVVLTLGPGITITGNAFFKKKSLTANAKGDIVKVSYDLIWQGTVVIDIPGLLVMATATSATIIYARGATTNKQVAGTAVIMGMTIEGDAQGLIKVSYSANWNGAVIESVAD